MEDFYQVLQVDPRAEPEVIDAAWRRLAQVYHPDGGQRPDPQRMAAINQAHQVLKDPRLRADYDLQRGQRGQPPPPPPKAPTNGRPVSDVPSGAVGWVAAPALTCWRHPGWAVAKCASCKKPLCSDCASRWRPAFCERCVISQGHTQQAWILWPVAAAVAWILLIVVAFTFEWSTLFPAPHGWRPPVWPTLLITYVIGAGIVGGVDLAIWLVRAMSRDVRRRAKKSLNGLTVLAVVPVALVAGAGFVPARAVMAVGAFLRGTAKVRTARAALKSG